MLQACRNKGVDCIVAPYEADAQLAYLNRIGVAQIIITEDSDLLLFGCERVSKNAFQKFNSTFYFYPRLT